MEKLIATSRTLGLDEAVCDAPEWIRQQSIRTWGEGQATVLIGKDPTYLAALEKLIRFGPSDSHVLITGETGTGKELFARALFLASNRINKPFLRVNCAQYTGEHIMVSELFGHKKGSFTGAIADHRGIFEEADGGVVFLDEIGDLPLATQAILLRLLSEREIVPVGGTHPKLVNVRVIVATSHDLGEMVAQGRFRADLFHRLRGLHVRVTPLRERGGDWELIARYCLKELGRRHGQSKRLAPAAIRELERHTWPGNVREVKGCVESGFHLSLSHEITFHDLAEVLESTARADQFRKIPFCFTAAEQCARMMSGEENFWELVYRPFMNRDVNRADARAVVAKGLELSGGSYRRLLELFDIAQGDYLKFMDFLRHHDLKPDAGALPRAHSARPAGAP